MSGALYLEIEALIRMAPGATIMGFSLALKSYAADVPLERVINNLPPIQNGDLARQIEKIVRSAPGKLSWEALGWSIATSHSLYEKWRASSNIELLWAGPSPAGQVAARRIDQVLYDLISRAKHSVLLITFAAYKIQRLNDALAGAVRRGVTVRMILEFEDESEKQLTMDAIKAFPLELRSAVGILYWPVEMRDRNASGRPGKLHAKAAIIDDCAVISSANLTDDAFIRNLELGALIKEERFVQNLCRHFEQLIASKVLLKWQGQ